ncbi:942_t:CDS:2, partial [Dentiscutata heterogama]
MSFELRDLPFPPNQKTYYDYLNFLNSLWSNESNNLDSLINKDASQDTITFEDSLASESTNKPKINYVALEQKLNY